MFSRTAFLVIPMSLRSTSIVATVSLPSPPKLLLELVQGGILCSCTTQATQPLELTAAENNIYVLNPRASITTTFFCIPIIMIHFQLLSLQASRTCWTGASMQFVETFFVVKISKCTIYTQLKDTKEQPILFWGKNDTHLNIQSFSIEYPLINHNTIT